MRKIILFFFLCFLILIFERNISFAKVLTLEEISAQIEILKTKILQLQKLLGELKNRKIYLASEKLEQGDTLLVKVEGSSEKISGQFDSKEIDFLKFADGWLGIIGIDAKKKPGKYNLFINFPDGSHFKKEINIVERKFPIQEFPITKEYPTPSKAMEDISKTKLTLDKIFSIYTKVIYFDQSFIYPLEEIEIGGLSFGEILKSKNFTIQHLGVDLKASRDTPIYAVNDGVVHFSENLGTYGKTLIIDHGFGIFSFYCHLNKFKVLKGKRVKRGDIIGYSGSTGYATASHLHFSMKVNRTSIDPLRFIGILEKEMIK